MTGVPPVSRHHNAPDSVKQAHDAAFKALNEAFSSLMDGETAQGVRRWGAGACRTRAQRRLKARAGRASHGLVARARVLAGTHRPRSYPGQQGGFARAGYGAGGYGARSGASTSYDPFASSYRGATGSSYSGWQHFRRRTGFGAQLLAAAGQARRAVPGEPSPSMWQPARARCPGLQTSPACSARFKASAGPAPPLPRRWACCWRAACCCWTRSQPRCGNAATKGCVGQLPLAVARTPACLPACMQHPGAPLDRCRCRSCTATLRTIPGAGSSSSSKQRLRPGRRPPQRCGSERQPRRQAWQRQARRCRRPNCKRSAASSRRWVRRSGSKQIAAWQQAGQHSKPVWRVWAVGVECLEMQYCKSRQRVVAATGERCAGGCSRNSHKQTHNSLVIAISSAAQSVCIVSRACATRERPSLQPSSPGRCDLAVQPARAPCSTTTGRAALAADPCHRHPLVARRHRQDSTAARRQTRSTRPPLAGTRPT